MFKWLRDRWRKIKVWDERNRGEAPALPPSKGIGDNRVPPS